MEIDQIENQNSATLFISLIAKGTEVWRMQSEMDYDYFGLRYLSFQTSVDKLQHVSKYYWFVYS